MLLQLKIERNDGSVTNIVTDSAWSCTISNGPIQGSSVWDGETYAVTNEAKISNWSTFSYGGESTLFTNAVTSYPVDPSILAGQPSDPIAVVQYLHPIDMWTNTDGGVSGNQFVRIFDMGQNIAGWCSISLVNTSQPAGTPITLRHAEVLQLDSNSRQTWGTNINKDSLGTIGDPAKQTDVYYIAKSSMTQQLQPHFTYHGFRFVEVAAPPDIVLDMNSLTASVIRSAARETGGFTCSHRDVNQLMTNILWTLRANLQGIETDCPQRNERFGWLGDSDAFSQTACFVMDMAALYTRTVRDIRDGQNINGYEGTVYFGQYQVNNPFAGKAIGDVGWSAGGVIKPWHLYQNYGDIRMLAEHYLSASNWIVFFTNINWPNYRFDNPAAWNGNGDALNGSQISFDSFGSGPADMSHSVHNYSFYAHSADLVANMSLVLKADAQARGSSSIASVYDSNHSAYTNIAFLVRSNFQRSASAIPAGLVTYDGTGTNVIKVGNGTQGDYAYALYFNMVPDTQRSNCAYLLLNAAGSGIHNYYGGYNDPFTTSPDTNHLSTGIQGTMRALIELTRNGYTADAYSLLLDYRFPSWLHQITNSGAIYSAAHTNYGATTSWERWDGLVSGTGGGYHAGYNSFNHFWAGAIGEWIYRNIVGIDPSGDAPGFENIVISPKPGGGITNVLGSFNSIHGPVTCCWTNDTGATNFALNIAVPVNDTNSFVGSCPVIGPDGTIYLPTYGAGSVYALAPGGDVKWRTTLTSEDPTNAPPIKCPAIDSQGTIYHAAFHSLYAISPQGNVLWTFTHPGDTNNPWNRTLSSPAIGPDGTIYVTFGTKLYALYGTNKLADSPWPMYRQNPRHTAKIEKPSLQHPKKRADANFEFQLYSQLGQTNTVETSSNFKCWAPLTGVVVTNVPLTVVDLSASNFTSRFYRVYSP